MLVMGIDTHDHVHDHDRVKKLADSTMWPPHGMAYIHSDIACAAAEQSLHGAAEQQYSLQVALPYVTHAAVHSRAKTTWQCMIDSRPCGRLPLNSWLTAVKHSSSAQARTLYHSLTCMLVWQTTRQCELEVTEVDLWA